MRPDDLFERVLVARRYYLEGRTRVQIAEEFGISRFKVSRMLDEALESGMVEIKIHHPGAVDVDLSTEVQRRYGLEHVYAVAADRRDDADRVQAVAKAMAQLLQSIVRDGDVVGVDCGRTLAHIAPHLTTLPRCDVVQLSGMAGAITANGLDLVRRISEVSGGLSWPLYAPLVVSDSRTAKSLKGNQQIQGTVARYPDVTCALVSIGAWRAGASQTYHSLSSRDVARFTEAGVCAETCALLLDHEGRRVGGLDDRRMGIEETALRAIPTRIAIATGLEKAAAIRAVLRSGLVTALVTDTAVAAAVLE
jgi:DNA-binding transcriptional regulator LsrR (DeoR family)